MILVRGVDIILACGVGLDGEGRRFIGKELLASQTVPCLSHLCTIENLFDEYIC
jgi:hypothetical protein